MAPEEARQERRLLKQQLFQIRLFLEGEREKLTQELKDLKEQYESLRGFRKINGQADETFWSDFPDRWDIGDPNNVKAFILDSDDVVYSDSDKFNVQRALGKSYNTIVLKAIDPGVNYGEEDAVSPPKTKQEIETEEDN